VPSVKLLTENGKQYIAVSVGYFENGADLIYQDEISVTFFPNYAPPVWPWKNCDQQQMAHIDFKADDLPEAVEHALKCGAKKSDVQFFDTSTI